MWTLNCIIFILGLTLVLTSSKTPDCTKVKADVVILMESSKEMSHDAFISMQNDVKKFLTKMPLGVGEGDIRVMLAAFGQHVHSYTDEWHTDAAKVISKVVGLPLHPGSAPYMTSAIAWAYDKLAQRGREGVKHFVLYTGTGKNSQSPRSLRGVMAGSSVRVFGIVETPAKPNGRPHLEIEENLGLFELWSVPGTNDMVLGIQELLNPHCSQCLKSIVDMAVLVEDVPSTVDTVPNPRYPKNWYPIMLNDVLITAMQKIRVCHKTTRVAVVSYGEDIYESQTFNFTTYKRREPLVERLKTFKYMNSKTQDVSKALRYARDNLFTPENSRHDATKIIVLMTYYPDVDKIASLAQSIRDRGIHIFIAGMEYPPHSINRITGSSFATLDGRGITYSDTEMFWYNRDFVRKTCIMGKFLD